MEEGVWGFGLGKRGFGDLVFRVCAFLVLAGTECLGGDGRLMPGWMHGRRYTELYLSERAGISSILRDIFQHRMATWREREGGVGGHPIHFALTLDALTHRSTKTCGFLP